MKKKKNEKRKMKDGRGKKGIVCWADVFWASARHE
jgi:hypothetical protein